MNHPILLALLSGCVGRSMIAAPVTDVVLDQSHNYTWSGTLSVANTDVPADADFTVDWSGLTTDLYGRPLAEVEVLGLVETELTRPELEDRLLTDQLWANYADEHTMVPAAGVTSIASRELENTGNELEGLAEDASLTRFLVWLSPTAMPALQMVRQVTPLASATSAEVRLVDGETTLTSTVDLHTAPAVVVSAGPPGTLDWSAVTHDAHGNEMTLPRIDEVVLARFDAATATDVEPRFDLLDTEAVELYRVGVELRDTSVALDRATDASGAAFGGFTTSGVWVVALRCLGCYGPPLVAAVVDVN